MISLKAVFIAALCGCIGSEMAYPAFALEGDQHDPRRLRVETEDTQGSTFWVTLSYQLPGGPDSAITSVRQSTARVEHRLPPVTRDSFALAKPAAGTTVSGMGCVQSKRRGLLSNEICAGWSFTNPAVDLPPPDPIIDSVRTDTTVTQPPPSGGVCQNEPAGLIPLGRYDGTSVSAPNAGTWHNATGGWSTATAATDVTAPRSPPGVVRYQFPAGTSGGPYPGWSLTFAAQRQVYTCWWVKISKPWDYHASVVNKLFFVGTNQNSNVSNEVVFGLIGSAESHAQILGVVQEPVNSGLGTAGGGYFPANMAQPGFALGVWHQVEAHLVANTSGQANGSMRWWVNGVLVGSYATVRYHTTTTGAFNAFFLQHYWGGNVDTKSQTDVIWDDDVYLSGVP